MTDQPPAPVNEDLDRLACLADVIARLDVVAVQESRRNPLALKRLLASLGPALLVVQQGEQPAEFKGRLCLRSGTRATDGMRTHRAS